jgi:NAD-dependent deacetylase
MDAFQSAFDMTSMDITIPQDLIRALRSARRVTALTGAGVSAESGVPTFREALTGLWAQYNPEELATPQAFRRNPKLVWEWYASRRQQLSQVQPNPGHLALAEMEPHFGCFTLITQNVDGLHQRAGSRNIIELHGNIQRVRCFDEDTPVETWPEGEEVPPRCPCCGGLLRPDVVWFGELLAPAALEAAFSAARACDVFLSIGTSGLVQPAASLPPMAIEQGTVVVEINPNPTPLTPYMTHVLSGPAGVVLPQLVQAVWK